MADLLKQPSSIAARRAYARAQEMTKLVGLVAIASVFIASTNLLVKASQVDGVTLYSKFSVTILSEMMKLLMSFGTAAAEAVSLPPGRVLPPHKPLSGVDLLLFVLPALMYVVANNLKYPILERVDPGLLSVLWNGKIICISIGLRLVFGTQLSTRQWGAVGSLLVGTSLAQVSQWDRASDGNTQWEGLLLVAVALLVVSTANVSCEYVYKRTADVPLWKQNVVLYSLGVGFNLCALLSLEGLGGAGFFRGFTGWVVAVVLCQALSGYCVGMMFKFIDNIAAIYADVLAMLLSSLLATLYFGLVPNLTYQLSVALSILSMLLYYKPGGDDDHGGLQDRVGILSEDEEEMEMLLLPEK